MKIVVFLFSWFVILSPALAVDVAPRISDREIIEGLSELKEGQNSLNQRLDDFKVSTNQRLDDLKASTNQRLDDMSKRFDDMNKRFDTLQATLWLFITIALAIMGAMGRILWEHQRQLTAIHASLETQKDEQVVLKRLIEKLLPPKGVL